MNLVKMEDSYRGPVQKRLDIWGSQIAQVLSCQGKELGPSKGKGRVFSWELK